MDSYYNIIKHYEACFEKFGDTAKGVDWPKQEDVPVRYLVMLDLIRDKEKDITLLDFGCGAAHLYEFIQKNHLHHIHYAGLDLSEKFITFCKSKWPSVDFYCLDLLKEEDHLPMFDYFIMNGVFTEKRQLTFEEMWEYFVELLTAAFNKCKTGIAFNVMSKEVDWERDDLFHVPLDRLTSFLTKRLSRNFVIRNDYGLYEYTVYLYH